MLSLFDNVILIWQYIYIQGHLISDVFFNLQYIHLTLLSLFCSMKWSRIWLWDITYNTRCQWIYLKKNKQYKWQWSYYYVYQIWSKVLCCKDLERGKMMNNLGMLHIHTNVNPEWNHITAQIHTTAPITWVQLKWCYPSYCPNEWVNSDHTQLHWMQLEKFS